MKDIHNHGQSSLGEWIMRKHAVVVPLFSFCFVLCSIVGCVSNGSVDALNAVSQTTDQTILANMASGNSDNLVRNAACSRLEDSVALANIAKQQDTAGAIARLKLAIKELAVKANMPSLRVQIDAQPQKGFYAERDNERAFKQKAGIIPLSANILMGDGVAESVEATAFLGDQKLVGRTWQQPSPISREQFYCLSPRMGWDVRELRRMDIAVPTSFGSAQVAPVPFLSDILRAAKSGHDVLDLLAKSAESPDIRQAATTCHTETGNPKEGQ
jgi:hypothetical protein